ncbi:hypothetical protein Tco_0335581 [Tanacetum coccineum]
MTYNWHVRDPRPSVSGTMPDLALKMRTNYGAARFPCRLLAMLCRFPCMSLFTVWLYASACTLRWHSDAQHHVSELKPHSDLPMHWPEHPCVRLGMSGSEPGEMAPESSKAVVLPKFEIHVYTSELTLEELKTIVTEYCIPTDLHPRLPPPGMTMDRLPSHYIGLYGHWFSFENKTGGRAKKCFKEVTTSLKGWKRKFFQLDRRAVPDTIPWRHGDTNLHDDFPNNYDEGEVPRMSELLVPLRPPPRHLLYVCGLTTACRHPELSYDIKDQDMNVIDMDTFLKLPTWTGTVVSRGEPLSEEQRPKPRVTPPFPVRAKLPELTTAQKNLEKPDAKIAAAREKKEQQSLVKARAKRAGTGGGDGSKKRKKAQKNNESIQSGSKATLSATPIHQASPETGKKPAAAAAEIAQEIPRTKKVVVDLSGNTRASTIPVEVNQPSLPREHDDAHVSPHFDVHSESSHHGNEEVSVANRYMPDWELRNDLRVCTFRAGKELVSHLATPAEDEFLGSLSNADFISRAYQTLGQSVGAQGELLKRHEELNRNYVDLQNRYDAQLEELDQLRPSLWRMTQENEDLNQRLTLLDSVHSECLSREKELLDRLVVAEEKIKVLEGEKLNLSGKVAQAEADRKKLVHEFIPAMVKRLHTSVEYRQSLAAPGLIVLYCWVKVANSCDLPMNELLAVCPDIPPLATGSTSRAAVEDASQQPPASVPKPSTDVPLGTTT